MSAQLIDTITIPQETTQVSVQTQTQFDVIQQQITQEDIVAEPGTPVLSASEVSDSLGLSPRFISSPHISGEDTEDSAIDDVRATLDGLLRQFEENRHFNVGYPESSDFDLEPLMPFMNYSINNCGDWSEYCNYVLNTFSLEKRVIRYFQDLFHVDPEDSWGYTTTGGTEGNEYGLFLAREMYPDSTVFFCESAHYSIGKICHLLRIPMCKIKSQANGIIDYDDLIRQIIIRDEHHPIIMATLGTTLHGACDNIQEIQKRLFDCPLNLRKEDYYIHCDAALSGMILPFVKDIPIDEGPVPPYKFSDGVDSIAVSGHKMIGSPFPCGVVVARKNYVDKIKHDVEYIAGHDCTILGSRNGHSVLVLWYLLQIRTRRDHVARLRKCFEMADFVVKRFKHAGVDAWRNPYSITVVFPAPSESCWKRNNLAAADGLCHIVATAHHKDATRLSQLVDDIIADYSEHEYDRSCGEF